MWVFKRKKKTEESAPEILMMVEEIQSSLDDTAKDPYSIPTVGYAPGYAPTGTSQYHAWPTMPSISPSGVVYKVQTGDRRDNFVMHDGHMIEVKGRIVKIVREEDWYRKYMEECKLKHTFLFTPIMIP